MRGGNIRPEFAETADERAAREEEEKNLSEDEKNTIKNRIHVVFNTERVLRISFSKVAPKALPASGTHAAMKEIVDEMTNEGQLTTV